MSNLSRQRQVQNRRETAPEWVEEIVHLPLRISTIGPKAEAESSVRAIAQMFGSQEGMQAKLDDLSSRADREMRSNGEAVVPLPEKQQQTILLAGDASPIPQEAKTPDELKEFEDAILKQSAVALGRMLDKAKQAAESADGTLYRTEVRVLLSQMVPLVRNLGMPEQRGTNPPWAFSPDIHGRAEYIACVVAWSDVLTGGQIRDAVSPTTES